MNEEKNALKFLLWGGGIALVLSGTVSLTKATYRMAEAAIVAQNKNQLSYGKFSRMLWSAPKSRVPRKRRTHE